MKNWVLGFALVLSSVSMAMPAPFNEVVGALTKNADYQAFVEKGSYDSLMITRSNARIDHTKICGTDAASKSHTVVRVVSRSSTKRSQDVLLFVTAEKPQDIHVCKP